MNRIFDLIAVACLAVVVLLPKASVEARPALDADSTDLARVALLEDRLAQNPKDEATAQALAEVYLRVEHPDWALIALAGFPGTEAGAKTWLLRATAHAERLEAQLAVTATKAGQVACEAKGCPADVAVRLQVIAGPMQALVDEHIDPRTDPQRAKEAVAKVLHATRPAKAAPKK